MEVCVDDAVIQYNCLLVQRSVNTQEQIMVQVTRENFQDILPAVRSSLQACEYYAFDCEMTGLFTNDNQQNYLDELEDRYAQVSKDHRMAAQRTQAPFGSCESCKAASIASMQVLPPRCQLNAVC